MHLYGVTRGASWVIKRFKSFVEAQYCDYSDGINKNMIQIVMRPVQMWEIVFPEDSLPEVLALCQTRAPLKPKKERKWAMKEWMRQSKYVWGLQKLLNLLPIPDNLRMHKLSPEKVGIAMSVRRDMEFIPIGIKEDHKDTIERL